LNEKIKKEYNLRRKDDSDSGRNKKERNLIDFIIDIFIESQSGKQVIDEQAELVKYSKLKSLANILFEYVVIIFIFYLTKKLIFRPNIQSLSDERKDLNASESVGDGDVSPS